MEPLLKNFVSSFKLAKGESHKAMAVFPITAPPDGGPDYLSMKEALEKGVFVVTEVSEGGSVPNLKVSNKGDLAVLLIDGEELAGAKQNRVLNTTILVAAGAELIVPVSCTEHGRWGYASREFEDAGHVMACEMRIINKSRVGTSLKERGAFSGDQSEVWNQVEKLSAEAGTSSRTGAMRDVFEEKKADLEGYLKAFSCGTDQRGLLVMIGGEVMGFDFVSREKPFAVLFPKLIKSYAMEAWLRSRRGNGRGGKDDVPDAAKAGAFLHAVSECAEKTYPSVGLGKDVRLEAAGLVGSALVVDGAVIHLAAFRATDTDKAGNMAGFNRRRSFRI
jgi:hypothetical protein